MFRIRLVAREGYKKAGRAAMLVQINGIPSIKPKPDRCEKHQKEREGGVDHPVLGEGNYVKTEYQTSARTVSRRFRTVIRTMSPCCSDLISFRALRQASHCRVLINREQVTVSLLISSGSENCRMLTKMMLEKFCII